MIHQLKSWPEFFQAIVERRKRHELRRSDDRNFSVGDILCLQEYDNERQRYTGREIDVRVTYITSSDYPCALSEGAMIQQFCILSVDPVDGVRQSKQTKK